MDITEEMLKAYVDGCNASGVADDEVDGLAVMRAGLRAVAPLIAAPALRQAEEKIAARANELRTGGSFRSGAVGIEYINGLEDAAGLIERDRARAELPPGAVWVEPGQSFAMNVEAGQVVEVRGPVIDVDRL